MLNVAVVMGRLVADPELRHTPSDVAVTSFMMAVHGSIQTRTYTDKDGNKRKATEIVANDVNFADSKRSDSGANYGAPSAPSYGNNYGSNNAAGNEMQRPAYSEPAPTYSSGNSGDFEEIIGDDDLPF